VVKRTFSFPDEKEEVYEKFKGMVPEVSGAIMEMIEGYVRRQEGLQAKLTEIKVLKGQHDHDHDVFIGQEFRFWGVKIASGEDKERNYLGVYLTKKGKFVVYGMRLEGTLEHKGFTIYDTYDDLAVTIPSDLLLQCQEYLGLNSNVRTYIDLDV